MKNRWKKSSNKMIQKKSKYIIGRDEYKISIAEVGDYIY